MTTVTGLTAARMLEIEAASVVDGDVVGDDLFLTKHDGTLINAGNVRGPKGADGPMGHSVSVLASRPVLDVGMVNQIRAGRQLTPADFTNMGLSVPIGLWNLGSVADASGNGRNLSNKGAVPFAVGINGQAASAAQFAGSTGQVLYIPDTGTSDPFRIKTGSFGCWVRSSKRGASQYLVTKLGGTTATNLFALMIGAGNVIQVVGYDSTAAYVVAGTTDICDDRWHFLVGTIDGTKIRAYVDGAQEGPTLTAPALLNATSAPFNIGGFGGDAANAVQLPVFGPVDEAFVISDVLSDEQVRNLYSASIPHTVGVPPALLNVTVQKRRRGAALATTDFPAQPIRLHNFVAGAYTDQGSGNVALVPNTGTGAIIDVSGPAGLGAGAKSFSGAHAGLSATDTGLPAGTNPRSYGVWLKTTSTVAGEFFAYGTITTGDARMRVDAAGILGSFSGADFISGPVAVNDGLWHHIVVVEENAPANGVKRKLYIDGKMVASSTVLGSIVLAGANRFRVGSRADGTNPFNGQLSRAFIYAGALTSDQVRALYLVSSQMLAPMPIISAIYIKAVETARLLGYFDTVEMSDIVNVSAMP